MDCANLFFPAARRESCYSCVKISSGRRFLFAANESIRVKSRNDYVLTLPDSRAASMSEANSPIESSDLLELGGQVDDDVFTIPTPSTLSTALIYRLRPSPPLRPMLNTTNLNQFAIVDTPSSSPNRTVLTRHLSKQERMGRRRIRMRWQGFALRVCYIKSNTECGASEFQ